MNYNIRVICGITVILMIIISLILQYTFKLNDKLYLDYISLYGIYILCYFTIQVVFSILNNTYKIKNITNKAKRECTIFGKINLLIVGYKEDPEYFKLCLQSIKELKNNIINLNKIYIIIDGNEFDDHYMIDIFNNIFENKPELIKSHFELNDYDIDDNSFIKAGIMDIINESDIICISQKHGGKRNAMYTGFRITLMENNLFNSNIETIFCTDSDTVVYPDCINNMYSLFDNPVVGGVTGNLGIYNKFDSFISFISSIRYWYAFNLERAYRSFNDYILCVSGPISMYRCSSIEKILLEWKNQIFLGKHCTYGDDRHLTNLILSLSQKVLYTPFAKADTETPNTLYRFYKQQIRWNKSAFREFFWTINYINNHSIFMLIDLIYTLIFPFIVICYFLYILYAGTFVEINIYITTILSLGIIKSIYGIIMSRNIEFIYYSLYIFVYVSIIFPAKIWALFNINDNNWGTSSRKNIVNNLDIDIIILILWNIVLVIGFCLNINRNIDIFNLFNLYYFISIFSLFIIIFITMIMYVKITQSKIKN